MALFQASAEKIARRIWPLFVLANDYVVSKFKLLDKSAGDPINIKRLEFNAKIYNLAVLIFIIMLNDKVSTDKRTNIIDLLHHAFLEESKRDQAMYRISDFIVNADELADLKNNHRLIPETATNLYSLYDLLCVPRLTVYHNILFANFKQFQNPAAIADAQFWKRTAEVFSILYKPTVDFAECSMRENFLYVSTVILMMSHIAVDREIVKSDLPDIGIS